MRPSSRSLSLSADGQAGRWSGPTAKWCQAHKAVDQRPQLKLLLVEAKQRHFEKVVVWSADRLARSMRHLVNVLSELNGCNVQIFSYRQGVDTSTPMGSMLWSFLGIFAEFEHGIRRERQAIGIAKAKEKGVRFGRPRISWAKRREILALREQGLGINKIARRLRVGTGSVVRTLQGAGQRPSQAPTPPFLTLS